MFMVWLLAYVWYYFSRRHDVNIQPRGEGGMGYLYAFHVTTSTYPISAKSHKHMNTVLSLTAIGCVLLAHFHYTTVQLNAETALSRIVTATYHASTPSVLIAVSPHWRRCARRRAEDINSCLTTDNGPRSTAPVSHVKNFFFYLTDKYVYMII
jgi:hypothetical protein